MKKVYYGEYNENGYTIDFVGNQSDPVYQAGNCKYDSAQYLPPNAAGTLDIITIQQFCESTGKDLAKENKGRWQGCTQIPNYEAGL
jgi:hypothetical protein